MLSNAFARANCSARAYSLEISHKTRSKMDGAQDKSLSRSSIFASWLPQENCYTSQWLRFWHRPDLFGSRRARHWKHCLHSSGWSLTELRRPWAEEPDSDFNNSNFSSSFQFEVGSSSQAVKKMSCVSFQLASLTQGPRGPKKCQVTDTARVLLDGTGTMVTIVGDVSPNYLCLSLGIKLSAEIVGIGMV